MLARLMLILFFAFALLQLPVEQVSAKPRNETWQQTRNSISERNGVWVWNRSEGGNSLELTIRGEVKFNDDSMEVKSLSSGGWLELKEKRGGVARQIEIKPSRDGGLSISYFVNGQNQPYDAEAKGWLARILTEAVTESGLNSGPRARKILREGGAGGLLDEVSRLKSDHVKQLYVQELYKCGSLDARTAVRLTGIVAREMSSDHYKAQVLTGLPEQLISDAAVRLAYLQTVASIRSDHYRAEALSAVLKPRQPSQEALLLALKGVSGISSDHYKTQVLLKVLASKLADGAVHAAYAEAATTIKSDHYRAEALSAVLKQGQLSQGALAAALRAAGGMSSDHYKAQVLLCVSESSLKDETVRSAFVEAVAAIGSDHYCAEVLAGVVGKGPSSKEALQAALKAAAGISSDHYKAELLLKLVWAGSRDESIRAALVEAARTIKSDQERGRVLSAVFR
jgi:hypothetical protein